MAVSEKAQRVYALLKKVPAGKVTTYSELGKHAGVHHRGIASIMHANPFAPEVACRRVVISDGRLGGYSLGVEAKIALLTKENVEIIDNLVDIDKYCHRW